MTLPSLTGVEPKSNSTTPAVMPAPSAPAAPVLPVAPVAPTSPRGIAKSKTAALDDPVFVTVADEPGAPVETLPTAIVAAALGYPLHLSLL